ncbi:hypothetical protein RF11_13283 [Thelohanellus kitauei]|uniref:Uncharacterized protein n=1 Tax=Thelohanellus kitauei TaxID=669202 RepID=A0A0C2MB54_THEKT|nr:hypothetical protein RF11_13283 [Thelohanellus kitauei]
MFHIIKIHGSTAAVYQQVVDLDNTNFRIIDGFCCHFSPLNTTAAIINRSNFVFGNMYLIKQYHPQEIQQVPEIRLRYVKLRKNRIFPKLQKRQIAHRNRYILWDLQKPYGLRLLSRMVRFHMFLYIMQINLDITNTTE